MKKEITFGTNFFAFLCASVIIITLILNISKVSLGIRFLLLIPFYLTPLVFLYKRGRVEENKIIINYPLKFWSKPQIIYLDKITDSKFVDIITEGYMVKIQYLQNDNTVKKVGFEIGYNKMLRLIDLFKQNKVPITKE